jgi:hypothetical protein
MMESFKELSLPKKIRYPLLLLLFGLIFIFGFLIISRRNAPDYSGFLGMASSIIQLSLAAVFFIMLLFFTESVTCVKNLKRATDFFLESALPEVLSKISSGKNDRLVILDKKLGDIFGCHYKGRLVGGANDASRNCNIKFWVGLNVNRLIFVIYIESKWSKKQLEEIFEPTFYGALKVGYDRPIIQKINGQMGAYSIWTTWYLREKNLLIDMPCQLFVMQDLSMFIESIIRTSLRHDVSMALIDLDPEPL